MDDDGATAHGTRTAYVGSALVQSTVNFIFERVSVLLHCARGEGYKFEMPLQAAP